MHCRKMGTVICGRKGTLLMTIIQKGGKMSDLNHDLHARAVKALSENEVRKMEHCVGFDRKKI